MGAAAEAAPEKQPSGWRPRKTVHEMVEAAKTRIQNLSIGQLQAELAAGGIQLLDIRDVRERQALGWIPGALHVPRGMLEFWVDPEERIVLYCAAGGRSALAADVLQEMGFPNVAHLEVGFNGWSAAGMPVQKPDAAEKD